MANHRFPAALCAALLFGAMTFVHAESYYLQDLGTLGGRTSAAFSLNNLGQVVGYADIPGNLYSHAVLYSGTGSNNIDLDASGPVGYPGNAIAINDVGQIVGSAYTASGRYQATLFTISNKTELGDICSDSTTAGEANAINNSGVIIGYSGDCDLIPEPTAFDSANTNKDYSLGGIAGGLDGVAFAINSAGLVVGYSTPSGSSSGHATLFTKTNNYDLGTLNDNTSQAYGINDANEIIGTSSVSNQHAFHATLFSGTGSNNIDLGTLGGDTSHALAINNHGEIAGVSYPSNNDNSIFHGFIYKNGVMRDLNDLVLPGTGFRDIRLLYGSGLQAGHAINDLGQIAAVGNGPNGLLHAVLLTPVLRRLGATIQGKNVVVIFDAVAGNTYRLQYTLDIAKPNWQNVPGVADLTATVTGSSQFTQTGGFTLPRAYYRVVLL